MFENLIQKKIKEEKSKAKTVMVYSTEGIAKSELSLFTKGFVNVETGGQNINPEILNNLIEKSVKLNLNYTLRPKWTLINYIFGKLDSVTTAVALRKLEIFRFYKFYEESVRKYVKENNPLALTKKKASALFDDADTVLHDRLLTNPTAVKTKNFFIRIFRLKYGDDSDISLNSSVPFGYVRIFLEDKSFYGLLEKFNVIKKLHDGKELELKDIIKIVSGKFITGEESLTDIAVKPDDAYDNTAEEDYSYISASEEMAKTFEEEGIVEDDETVAEKKFQPENEIKLLKLFSREETERILKKVFANNRIRMYESMNEITEKENWSDAAEKLKDIFLENKVNIYNKDVIRFVDVINDYFNKKSGQ